VQPGLGRDRPWPIRVRVQIRSRWSANLQTRVTYDITGNGIYLEVTNDNSVGVPLHLFDYYTQESSRRYVDANDTFKEFLSLEQFYGWYDISVETDADPTFQARLAGHLETGEDSMSDPSLDGSVG
jgi:phospholipase C